VRSLPQLADSDAACGPDPEHQATDADFDVVTMPIQFLRPADSPRLKGEDKAHIARLAETESPLPPILVDRSTMRVIDGMHRLMAASLQGRQTIDVVFFKGSEQDVFLRAVQENIAHGLPLSQGDRRAAAERIVMSHPHLSDRAIGQVAGLAAKTVARIRKHSDGVPESNARVGMDGKVRPLDSGKGRRRAAELLTEQPEASLRDVARAAGISPATALDVRKRLARGEPPTPQKASKAGIGVPGPDTGYGQDSAGTAAVVHGHSAEVLRPGHRPVPPPIVIPDPAATVEKLMRDPSLRGNEKGKEILRLLHINAVGAEQLPEILPVVPPHCLTIVVKLARHYAKLWNEFAQELDGRARIIDPSANVH
jgi:ParB-like chromosome segregation protein Spo0J